MTKILTPSSDLDIAVLEVPEGDMTTTDLLYDLEKAILSKGWNMSRCCAMLCYDMSYYIMLCYDKLCHVMLCYVILCYVMVCYIMLCHDMSCHVMLCYVLIRSVMI